MAAKVTNTVPRELARIQKQLAKSVRDGVIKASEFAAGELRRSIKAKLKTRTGGLQRSFKATLLVDSKDRVKGGAFSDSVYARIQDEGGTIRPKTRKALAVPISQKAKTTVGLWPRHWAAGQLRYVPRPGKAPLLVEDHGRFKKIRGSRSGASEFEHTKSIIHYVLMRSVTIRAHNYVEHARANVIKHVLPMFKGKIALAVGRPS